MRLRAGSRWLYPLTLAVAVIISPLLSAGCGGGSSSAPSTPTPSTSPTATPTPTPTPGGPPVVVTTNIIWGPRVLPPTRAAVTGPSSAVSAVITLTQPSDPPKVVLTQAVNRTGEVELGGQKSYSSDPQRVSPGVYTLTVKFFSDYGGQGTQVAIASAFTTVLGDGSLTATIAAVGSIQKITIPAGQIVRVGETRTLSNAGGAGTLLYEPRDDQNNIIALPTADTISNPAFIQLTRATSTVPGQPSAAIQGASITGLAPNRATIRVALDNALSAEAEVIIRSNVVIAVTPQNATVSRESQQQFLANIQNDGSAGVSGVTWSIKEGATVGTIDATGLFTSNLNEGTYTIVARSNYDPDIVVETPVTVASLVAVTVNPNPVDPVSFKGGQVQFTASVSFVPVGKDTGVTWSVETANGGTITPDGLYTAPALPGDYVIVATSNYDNRKSTRVTIPVRSLVNVTVPINSATVSIREKRTFTANVTGVPPGGDTSVTWNVDLAPNQGGKDKGTIDANTGEYTAPAAPVDVIITAASRFDPAKSATIAVAVRSFVQIKVNPATFTLSVNNSVKLAATVTGVINGGDVAVTWTAPDGGTVSADGLFTAPASVPNNEKTFRVIATSNFDPATTATALITVQSGSGNIIIK